MWQRPKTDWNPSDFFNIADYNRIKGNLNEIRSLALVLWPDFEYQEMGDDKTYLDMSFYADEINKFEANLDMICDGTYPFDFGQQKTYADNTPFIDWQELNRIESACLKLHDTFIASASGRKQLPFTLNGGDF